jgi:hypothetical protein
MKKILLLTALVASTVFSYGFTGEDAVSKKVLENFRHEFSTATNVQWLEAGHYYRAAFTFNGQNIFAYYAPDGELLSVARYISSLQLPINLLTNLKNDYSDYWISDLFEVNKSESTHYYVTLEDAESRIMLHSVNGSSWQVHSKSKKV